MNKYILVSIILILIVIAGISGYFIGSSQQKLTKTATVTNTITQTIISSPQADPANLGNGEDYLINPVFPDHTIAAQYAYVTPGNGEVFIGNPYLSGNGYLAGAKGAAVVASMLGYQPLITYNYYLYINSPSCINVAGAVKTDSATVMYLGFSFHRHSSAYESLGVHQAQSTS